MEGAKEEEEQEEENHKELRRRRRRKKQDILPGTKSSRGEKDISKFVMWARMCVSFWMCTHCVYACSYTCTQHGIMWVEMLSTLEQVVQ